MEERNMEQGAPVLKTAELLEAVFNLLVETLRLNKIIVGNGRLSKPAMAEVGNDSDYHRTRIGFMKYESVVVLKLDGRSEVLAFGTAYGAYPADAFKSDIALVPLGCLGKYFPDKQAREALEENKYFVKSLLVAMSDGSLSVVNGVRIGNRVSYLLERVLPKEVAIEGKIDPDRYRLYDLRPIIKSGARYEPSFAKKLCEILYQVVTE